LLKDNLLISDLAKETGVSVRTIRYYIMEGLLPSPQVRGRYSVYDDTYLHRIRLIKILKDAYLPLSKIRELLSNLTPEEIKSTLENYEKEPPLLNVPFPANLSADMPGGLSAKEYIRRVRDSQGPPSRTARLYQAENLVKAQPKTPPEPELDSKDFLESIEKPDASPSTTLPAFLRRVAPGVADERDESESCSQNWVRIEVAPGIELNIREDVYQRRKHQIEELLKLFKG
jgi:hypothetical protein